MRPHGVEGELGGLARLIFVKFCENGADKVGIVAVADVLGDGDDPDVGPLQLAAIMFEQILVAEEPAEGIDAELGDPATWVHGFGEHRLEAGTVVVSAGHAAVGEDVDEFDARPA